MLSPLWIWVFWCNTPSPPLAFRCKHWQVEKWGKKIKLGEKGAIKLNVSLVLCLFSLYPGTNRISHAVQGAHEGGIFALCMLRDGTLVSGGGKDRKLISWNGNYQKLHKTEVKSPIFKFTLLYKVKFRPPFEESYWSHFLSLWICILWKNKSVVKCVIQW